MPRHVFHSQILQTLAKAFSAISTPQHARLGTANTRMPPSTVARTTAHPRTLTKIQILGY